MTYLLLDTAFLVAAAIVAVTAELLGRGPRWSAVGIVAAALVVLTIVFDNVLVGVGIVAYRSDLILGIRIGVAPIEDFAYPIAAALLLPSLWSILAGRPAEAAP